MDDLRNDIITMQRKFHDYLDKPNHPQAVAIRNELQHLEDDAQTHKNPRTLDDRIKRLQYTLHNVRDEGIMDHGHLDDIHDRLEELRKDLRKIM